MGSGFGVGAGRRGCVVVPDGSAPPRAPMREAERRGGGGAGGVVGFVFLQRCVGADVGDHVGPTCGQWVGL